MSNDKLIQAAEKALRALDSANRDSGNYWLPEAGELRDALDEAKKPTNEWKEAVLDQLATHCIDAPIGMPPSEIIKKILAVNADIAVLHKDEPAEQQGEQALVRTVWAAKDAVKELGQLGMMPTMITVYGSPFEEASPINIKPQPDRVKAEPLTEAQVWASDEIMSVNSKAGLLMETVLCLVRAVESAHGIGVQQEGE